MLYTLGQYIVNVHMKHNMGQNFETDLHISGYEKKHR